MKERKQKDLEAAGWKVGSTAEFLGSAKGCDLCGDTSGAVFLHARCHPSAPMRASMEGNVLTLRCYLPDCDRMVVQFNATVIK